MKHSNIIENISETRKYNNVNENPRYLTEQILTYMGNKRALLPFIADIVLLVKKELNKQKITAVDLFSGSGIVSRFLKAHCDCLYMNDLEDYCYTINKCYMANKKEIDFTALNDCYTKVVSILDNEPLRSGFISEMYAPKNDKNIQEGERVFYTTRNANYIDTARQLIGELEEPYRTFLLAPLLYEASVHTNTCGKFKGFYKNSKTGIGQFGGDGRNALKRIMADIKLPFPVFSNYNCNTIIYKCDSNVLAKELPLVDFVYIDPPYNQHPYSSNYFMLNLIDNYIKPTKYSNVCGIPVEWNKSAYNKKQTAYESMIDLCKSLNAKYMLVSFNNEGYITKEEMVNLLSSIGKLIVYEKNYNTFRASRNFNNRSIYVKEYLYLVRK